MKYILQILIFLALNAQLFAQCDNNVSTDYTKPPTNDALPTNPSGYQFLNEFNWIPRDANGILEKIQTINLDPGLLTNGEALSIKSPQFDAYYSYLYNDLDPNPQNGWEIISFNTGYFPNGDVITPTPTFTDFPYIILYNKYESILRVYGILGPGYADFLSSIDAVVVKLKIEDGIDKDLNGLLRLTEGLDKPLDQKTSAIQVASVTKHQNKRGWWFSADFQLAYDPCVCYFDSKLEFEYDFIETAFDFTAEINSITVEEDLVDGQLVDSDFLNHFNYTNTGEYDDEYEASNGYLIYESIDRLLEDYINEMQAYEDSLDAIGIHNKEVKRRKWIAKAGKYVLKAGTAALTGGGSAATDLATWLPVVAPDLLETPDSLYVKLIIKELDKVLPKQINTLISDWVGEEIDPSELEEPITPTANFTESTMRGKITKTVKDWSGHRIHTPGSYDAADGQINSNEEYPIYNEALGVFALLETPKIRMSVTSVDDCSVYDQYTRSNDNYPPCDGLSLDDVTVDLYEMNKSYRIQIALEEELKYLINPTLDIESYSVEALFDVKTKIDSPESNYELFGINSYDTSIISTDKTYNANIESIRFDVENDVEIKDINGSSYEYRDRLDFNTPHVDVNALNNYVASYGYQVNLKVPKDDSVFNDFYFWYNNTSSNWPCVDRWWKFDEWDVSNYNSCEGMSDIIDAMDLFELKEFYLKMKINVVFAGKKTNGQDKVVTYNLTYRLDPDNDIIYDYNNPIDPNLVAGSPGHINQYPEYLFLDSENFNGQPVEGCQLNGSTYLCKAIEDVTLTGTFTVANGYNVIVEASNQIEVSPEAITPPEMVWQIVPVWDYSNPMPPVDAEYVSNFCQTEDLYAANSGSKSLRQADSLASGEEEEAIVNESSIFDFTLYPNPTNGRTTARIALEENAIGDLYITDLNGRKLSSAFENERIRKGEHQYNMPTDKLSSGIYLVHLFVNGEHHVKRLVKQ
jgi:hypothetical protein